jgi:hypothetical protein
VSYTSTEACRLAGCSYRQLDYWAREGKLGPPKRPGAGKDRSFEDYEVVLLRACALMVEVVPQAQWDVSSVVPELRTAYRHDPRLTGWRLVIEADKAYIARSTAAPCALVVNLAICSEQVGEAVIRAGWLWDKASG